MISEEENCGKQKSDNVTAGNNIVDSYWKCYVRTVAVLFLLPSGLPTGGTTGIALLVNRLTGLSVSMFVLGFNIVMLVVGFIFLGKKFAFTTIVSTFTYPICLELFGQIFANVHFTDDIWLNTIFSGLGIGWGLEASFVWEHPPEVWIFRR